MKIALVQIKSETGDVEVNLSRHLRSVEMAATLEADLVIFPELSLTGYAPEFARELAMEMDNPRLAPFTAASARHQLTIGVGMPVKTAGKPQIGLALFEPNGSVNLYGKRYLHEDELPTFLPGENFQGPIAKSAGLALAICYEISIEAHALMAKDRGAYCVPGQCGQNTYRSQKCGCPAGTDRPGAPDDQPYVQLCGYL